MPKICFVADAAADVVIRTRDHCDPHAHAIDKKLEIKVFFSLADNDPCHLSVQIVEGKPTLAQINDVIDEVEARAVQCRKRWWEIHKSICLVNQNVAISPAGVLTWVSPPAGTKISMATYSPIHRNVSFGGYGGAAHQIAACP